MRNTGGYLSSYQHSFSHFTAYDVNLEIPPLIPKYAHLSPLWWYWFQPAWEEGLVFIPDQLIIPFSAPISNSGKLPHLISRSVSSMPDSLPTINKDSLVHLSTLFFLPQFPFVLIRLWGPFFNWGISMTLRSGASHRSRVIFPDCQISNFHFFFSGLGIVSRYHSFLKTAIFSSSISDCICNQLGHPHYLSTSSKSHFWPLSKVLFPEFQFFSLLGNYIWLLNFLVNPSCTAIDQYCHNRNERNEWMTELMKWNESKTFRKKYINMSNTVLTKLP